MADNGTDRETAPDQDQSRSGGTSGFKMDTTYPRSIEGILRIVTVPIAALSLIFVIAALFESVGGWFFVVGFSYILYVVIVFVIEMCIPRVYVHRLIDAIVVFAYAGLWLFSSVLNTVFAAKDESVLLGLAALCGYICSILCVFQGIFALRTWRTYEDGRRGSQPIIFI